ncbi:MAG: bifunctional hydroxymethylpyrimidine kinase/phosphomethylpyrimidine kinase [Rhodospirillales bacterium]
MKGRVLVVAGSDSGGGAGIQADIKTITALGGFAMTAVTALTAQNTKGVTAVHAAPPGFVAEQIKVTLEDLGADAVKTGMLADAAIITAVADSLDWLASGIPWVIDPVMVAKGGDRLLAEDAAEALKARLVAKAAVVTPNLPEAAALTGLAVDTVADMEAAGRALVAIGAKAALVKGGHLAGDTVVDVLVTGKESTRFESKRIETRHTHGTGCTLASAIACSLAQGMSVEAAVVRARDYVQQAIRTAPGYGSGHGPLNHAHTVRP